MLHPRFAEGPQVDGIRGQEVPPCLVAATRPATVAVIGVLDGATVMRVKAGRQAARRDTVRTGWKRLGMLLLGAAVLACAGPAAEKRPAGFPPDLPGTVSGTVTGSRGEAIEGAVLTLRGIEGSADMGAVSGQDGSYAMAQVPPGDWRLFAAASGYEDFGPKRVRVRPGEGARADVEMEAIPEVPRFKPGPDGAPALPKKLAVLPAGWRVEWVGDVAAFAMPRSWKEVGGEGEDSWARDFEGDGVAFAYRFGYSFGPFSCPERTRCRERIILQDGKEAQLLNYEDREFAEGPRFFLGLYFPDVGGDATFSLWIYAAKEEDLKTAETIFKSVHFP